MALFTLVEDFVMCGGVELVQFLCGKLSEEQDYIWLCEYGLSIVHMGKKRGLFGVGVVVAAVLCAAILLVKARAKALA